MNRSSSSGTFSCHLLLVAGMACSTLDYSQLGSDGPVAGAAGAAGHDASLPGPDEGFPGGAGGGPVEPEDAGRRASAPELPPTAAADGGFVSAPCSAAPVLDAAARVGDAEAGGAAPLQAADRDCDGVEDVCEVVGACASAALVAHYLFERSLRDATPYLNTATAAGDIAYAAGVVGEALTLRGGSAATIARSESLEFSSALTLEVWLQARTLPSSGARAGLIDDEGRYGMFLMLAGEVRCVAGAASVSGGAVRAGEWAHLACVLDVATLTLWQDGHLLAQVPSGGPLNSPGELPIVVGGNAPSGDRLDGTLDNLRIWNQAQSALFISTASQTRVSTASQTR